MKIYNAEDFPPGSAARNSLACCSCCHKLCSAELARCDRCGTRIYLRVPYSVQATLALVITAILFYIPANVFPVMTTTLLGNTTESTIIGGVIVFFEHGSYFIASVIFIASVVIPLAKMVAIIWICHVISNKEKYNHHDVMRLYRMTEFVGKWSMIDVYVVALLVALVQIEGLISIQPGAAANAFATVVVLTMLAAKKLDMRLIWDKLDLPDSETYK